MRELSLFSGAGGGLLGTHLLGWKPVGYVEWNEYCQRVIAARIKDGMLPNAPIFGDIHAFLSEGYAAAYSGMVDVVTGGFPCQPFSLAGKRQGAADERNGWPATIECLRLVRPRYALLENVPGILTSGYFGTILGDLAESGFDCRWRVLSAAEMGAPHRRDRLWIMAYARSTRRQQISRSPSSHEAENGRQQNGNHQLASDGESIGTTDVADANQERRDRRTGQQWPGRRRQFEDGSSQGVTHAERKGLAFGEGKTGQRSQPAVTGGDWWAVEPDIRRVANGVASRVDRLKALGNGQVPAVVRAAWELMGA